MNIHKRTIEITKPLYAEGPNLPTFLYNPHPPPLITPQNFLHTGNTPQARNTYNFSAYLVSHPPNSCYLIP